MTTGPQVARQVQDRSVPPAPHQKPRGVHVVDSLPLPSAEHVFREAAMLGDRLLRMPDGDTGLRSNWLRWQADLLAQQRHVGLEVEPDADASDMRLPRRRVRVRSGVMPDDLCLGDLGYADAARASYAVFAQLKQADIIPRRVRLQVCLPSPLALVQAFVVPEQRSLVMPAYGHRLLEEVDEIAPTIPHAELAIWWDVAFELAVWEATSAIADRDRAKLAALDQLGRLGNRVPPAVGLGHRRCYRDHRYGHGAQPRDTWNVPEAANGIAARVDRTIEWLHLPVPRRRHDQAYFRPLRELRLRPEIRRYLGPVQLTHGLEGTNRRIAAARTILPDVGVATECGFGQREPATVAQPLRRHAAVADPMPTEHLSLPR